MSLPEDLGKGGLFMTVGIPHGLRYTYGYRSICISPPDAKQAAQVRSKVGSETVVAVIDFSPISPPNIEIWCEELVFVGDTSYSWPEKSVLIRCRKVALVDGSNTRKVSFDLSGKDGQAPKSPKADAQALSDGNAFARDSLKVYSYEDQVWNLGPFGVTPVTRTFHGVSYTSQTSTHPAKTGLKGLNGSPGERGGNSGSFVLLAEEVDESVWKVDGCFVLILNGGNGGAGQAGGDGTQGGDGLDFQADTEKFGKYDVNEIYQVLCRSFLGAKGGEGGNGGPGGRGGNSGSVKVAMAGQKIETIKNLFVVTSKAGTAGTSGADGSSGRQGQFSKSRIYQLTHNNANDGLRNWKWYAGTCTDSNEKNIAEQIYSWVMDKKEPPTSNMDAVKHLDGDELWNIYPDKRQDATVSGSIDFLVASTKDLQREYANEPLFLDQLYRRLSFQHFMLFTTQQYPPPSAILDPSKKEQDSPAQASFRISMKWIQAVLPAISAHPLPKPPVYLGSVQSLIATLIHTYVSTPLIDPFDNPTNYVPESVNQSELRSILNDFQEVEKLHGTARKQLAENQSQRNVMQKDIDTSRKIINNANSGISRYETKLKDLVKVGQRVSATEKQSRDDLETAFKGLKEQIEKHVDCDWAKILETLSTVLMFTDAKNPAAMVGAGLSVGTSVATSMNDAFNKVYGADKKMLYTRLDVMTKDGNALKEEIGQALARIASDQEAQEDYRTQIVVDQSKFDAMWEQYFTQMSFGEDVRARFKAHLKAIDRKNKLVAEYNRIFAEVAKLRVIIFDQKEAIDSLLSQSGSLDDEELQLIGLYMSRAYSEMGRFAFRSLYSQVRAFNCISFGYCNVFEAMSSLQTFGSVTADILTVTAITNLQQAFYRLRNEVWSSFPGTTTTVTMVLTTTKNPVMIESLKNERSLLLDIDWEMFNEYLGQDQAWDVRLHQMSVFLIGAKVDKSKLSDAERLEQDKSGGSGIVRLDISSSGSFQYMDKFGVVHLFELPKTKKPFSHLEVLDLNHKPEDFDKLKTSKDIEGETFNVKFLDDTHPPVPLQSPLGVWTIVPAQSVDLTELSAVRFVFEISHRARKSF